MISYSQSYQQAASSRTPRARINAVWIAQLLPLRKVQGTLISFIQWLGDLDTERAEKAETAGKAEKAFKRGYYGLRGNYR